MRKLFVIALSIVLGSAGLAMAGGQGDACCAPKKEFHPAKKTSDAKAVKLKAAAAQNFQPAKKSH